jgi:hypothetical protein
MIGAHSDLEFAKGRDGQKSSMLDRLVRDGLATIEPKVVLTGTRRVTVVWVALTHAGRLAVV